MLSSRYPLESGLEHLSFNVWGLFRYRLRYKTNAVLPTKAARTNAAKEIPAMTPVSILPSSIILLEDSTFGGILVCRNVVSNDSGFSVTIRLSEMPSKLRSSLINSGLVKLRRLDVNVELWFSVTLAYWVILESGRAIMDTFSVVFTGVHCICWIFVEFVNIVLFWVIFVVFGGWILVSFAKSGLAVVTGVLVKYIALACRSANCLSTSKSGADCCTSSDWGAARFVPVLAGKETDTYYIKKYFDNSTVQIPRLALWA